MSAITWVLERNLFDDHHDALAAAARDAGHKVVDWRDDWTREGFPKLEGTILFHGSLGNAVAAQRSGWEPGAFCDVAAFHCSAWYERAKSWLVHEQWAFTTVEQLVAEPRSVLANIGINGPFFVRPDSPLKPFSGRVLNADGVTLQALDHGFYFEDVTIPVVVAPVQEIGNEWRFVAVGRTIVAASSYEASSRSGEATPVPAAVEAFAKEIVQELEPPEDVYILDVCKVVDRLRLLELNPFSGADLYNCDRGSVVRSVADLLK